MWKEGQFQVFGVCWFGFFYEGMHVWNLLGESFSICQMQYHKLWCYSSKMDKTIIYLNFVTKSNILCSVEYTKIMINYTC